MTAAIAAAMTLSILAAPVEADDAAPAATPTQTPTPTPTPTNAGPTDPSPSGPAPTDGATPAPDPTEDAPPAPPSAAPAEEAAPQVSLDRTTYSGLMGRSLTVTGRVDAPASATVRITRLTADGWVPQATATRASDGSFSAAVTPASEPTSIRAEVLAGTSVEAVSTTASLQGRPVDSTIVLRVAPRAKDYTKVPLKVDWTTEDGRPVNGKVQLKFLPSGSSNWRHYKYLQVWGGYLSTGIVPREDGRFAVRSLATDTLTSVVSPSVGFDNLPPGGVVRLPAGTYPPMGLPRQPKADRLAADVKVTTLPSALWRSMQGRSYHAGCPVGRSQLRLVQVSYWAHDGYLRRGQIIVNRSVAWQTASVFSSLFDFKVPIRSMYPVDRFGYHPTLRGANDYLSMRSDNTSGFNCRRVVGSPSRMSPHAYGTAIDVNPWENPFSSAQGWTPNGIWQNRSTPENVTWRGYWDSVVTIFRRNGFRWLGYIDQQHFER